MSFSFELAASSPWSPMSLPETIIDPRSMAGTGTKSGMAPVRVPPDIAISDSGEPWLSSPTFAQAVTVIRSGAPLWFPVIAADLDHITMLLPMDDGGVLILGHKDRNTNVLARLDHQSGLLWRRTGPVDRQARYDRDARASLGPADLRGQFLGLFRDGPQALLWAEARTNQDIHHHLVRVDLQTGETTGSEEVASSRTTVQIRSGRLAHWEATDNGYDWVVRRLDTGAEQRTAVPSALHSCIELHPVLLPDGGILCHDLEGALLWSNDGGRVTRLPLAGIVRQQDDLLVGLAHEPGQLVVERWRHGVRVGTRLLAPVGDRPRLFFSENDRLWVLHGREPAKLSVFDVNDTLVDQAHSLEPTERLQYGSNLRVRFPGVDHEGHVVLSGADAQGAYIVRIVPVSDDI